MEATGCPLVGRCRPKVLDIKRLKLNLQDPRLHEFTFHPQRLSDLRGVTAVNRPASGQTTRDQTDVTAPPTMEARSDRTQPAAAGLPPHTSTTSTGLTRDQTLPGQVTVM